MRGSFRLMTTWLIGNKLALQKPLKMSYQPINNDWFHSERHADVCLTLKLNQRQTFRALIILKWSAMTKGSRLSEKGREIYDRAKLKRMASVKKRLLHVKIDIWQICPRIYVSVELNVIAWKCKILRIERNFLGLL